MIPRFSFIRSGDLRSFVTDLDTNEPIPLEPGVAHPARSSDIATYPEAEKMRHPVSLA